MALYPFNSKYPVSQKFGVKNSAYRLGFHPGTDYKTPVGVAVKAEEKGYNSWLWSPTYGNVAALVLANGDVIWHAHNSKVGKTGNVNKGDIIAYTGNTGWTTGPHSHIEHRVGGNQNNVRDYEKWLANNPEPLPPKPPTSKMPAVGSTVKFTIPRTFFNTGTTSAKGTLLPDARIVRAIDPNYPYRIVVNSASLGQGSVALYDQAGVKIPGWTVK